MWIPDEVQEVLSVSRYDMRNREYTRGRCSGKRVALSVFSSRGWDALISDAKEMVIDSRKRTADEFDRGYALGFIDVIREVGEASKAVS